MRRIKINEKEHILELLKTKTEPTYTASIWFDLSQPPSQHEWDKTMLTVLLLELEKEGRVERHDIDCLNYWTYRTPNILQKLLNMMRGKHNG